MPEVLFNAEVGEVAEIAETGISFPCALGVLGVLCVDPWGLTQA